MGVHRRSQDHSRRREAIRRTTGPCMHGAEKSSNWVWRPAVPSWEKEFCLKVGLFPWEKFLEAKRHVHLSDKIIRWNDSAAEESFKKAKTRFYAEMNGLPCDEISTRNPDMFIDEVDWNNEDVDAELLSALEVMSLTDDETDQEKEKSLNGAFRIPMEAIKATGWDVPVETQEEAKARVLKNLIVGGH